MATAVMVKIATLKDELLILTKGKLKSINHM